MGRSEAGMEERTRKIALVGTQGYDKSPSDVKLDCFPWERFSKGINLRDYDVVVLNLLSLSSIKDVDWASFFNSLNFGAMLEITQGEEGMIILVGDPRFDIPSGIGGGQDVEEPFLRWTGVRFDWDEQPGNTVIPATGDNQLNWYFRNLKRWEYSLRDCELYSEGLKDTVDRQLKRLNLDSGKVNVRIEPLCRNRYGNLLSFILFIAIEAAPPSAYSGRLVRQATTVHFGPVIFLPETTLGEDKTLRFLLRDVCGVEAASELPPWSSAYALPQESEKKDELRELNEELDKVLTMMGEKEQSLAELEKQKILFTGSGEALEAQVWRTFEDLGFDVAKGGPGRDDLIIRYKERVAVVEIKGVLKSTAEKHATQLEKWVSDYYSSHEQHPNGILVVNAYCDTPLKDRDKPAFPDQMLGYSKRRGHCLITGIQLLNLYLDCRDDPEKKDAVIGRLFSTEGVFEEYRNWPDYLTLDENDSDA
jgi:hypothetical protein